MGDKKPKPYEIYDQIEGRAQAIDDAGSRRKRFATQDVATSLCSTCKYAQIMRRRGEYFQTIRCSVLSAAVPPDIDECSAYATQTSLSLMEMSQMAKLVEAPRDTGGHYL